jgi:COP9 signalosome complex subunit 7
LARSRQNLTYDALKKHLELDDARELEDLIISAVYAGLLDATLDPHRAAVQVHSVAALRDLAPGAIPPMIASLKAWSGRCGNTLEDLEQQIEGIKSGAAQRAREKKEQDAEMEKLLAQATDEGSLELQAIGGGGRRVVGNKNLRPKRPGPPEDEGAEAMDLDDDDDGMAKTRASRRKL